MWCVLEDVHDNGSKCGHGMSLLLWCYRAGCSLSRVCVRGYCMMAIRLPHAGARNCCDDAV